MLALVLGWNLALACRFDLGSVATPCSSDRDCPRDQRCGADRRCSISGPGTADGGTLDGGALDGGGEDGGAGTDGGLADGGEGSDGGLPPLTWSAMVLPQNTRCVNALWGRSDTEVYAGTSTGRVLRYDGNQWTNLAQNPNNGGILSISGSADRLFIGDNLGWFYRLTGASWESFFPRGSVAVNAVLARSNTEVYAVTEGGAIDGPGLFLFDGQGLTRLWETASGLAAVSGGGALGSIYFAGAQGKIFRLLSGEISEETVVWPEGFTSSDIAQQVFYGLAPMGSFVYAVGTRRAIFVRAGGQWTQVYSEASGELRAIAGWRGLDAYAVGSPDNVGSVVRFDSERQEWRPQGVLRDYDLWALWSAGPDTYFAGGCVYTTFDGVLFRGRRPQ